MWKNKPVEQKLKVL